MNEQIHAAEVRGMTLRDWFAGMELQGYNANREQCARMSHEEAASAAYRDADAMIAARGHNEPPRTIEPWMPPLPEGAVLLGKGGTFKAPRSDGFEGWVAEPHSPSWDWAGRLAGLSPVLYYAAPADSEIAKLNGLEGGEA